MRRVGVVAFALVAAGCLAGDDGDPAPSPAPEPWFAFGAPVAPTPAPDGYGSEPGLLVARDGAIYVVTVLGSATARGDGLWKSTDGGATWEYLGKPDYPFGGGDADLDEDEAGTIYLPGQWRPTATGPFYITAGESMAVSKDKGRTWTTNPIASNAPVADRQWAATYKTGTVWLAFNQAQRGLTVTKSSDSGLTWGPPRSIDGTWDPGDGVALAGGPNGIPGDILADPRDGSLYLPYGPGIGASGGAHRLFISRDGGAAFHQRVIHFTPAGERGSAIFGTLAMDDAGHLYYAWAESHGGGQGTRVLLRTSRDRGESWSAPVAVTPAGMTAVFPWVAAGAPGHVAVALYLATGTFSSDDAPADTAWYPVVALSRNAIDGNGTFELAALTTAPNHKGPICTGGTGCTSGRDLGDFFEIALTPDGRVAAVWADDSGSQRTNVVAVQSRGSLRA